MLYFFLLLVPLVVANPQQFANSLIDKPIIECGANHISLKVRTEKDAPAHIFAKGFFKKEGCTFNNAPNATFDFSECGVRRKREIKPKGISFEMTVVVQLHPLFVTKVDRAFHVQCFFKEEEKAVGTGMNVSDLASEDVEGKVDPPKCTYSIRQDSVNGPLVHVTEIGKATFHIWDCPSETHSTLIHSCEIIGGETKEMFIDEHGCSMMEELIPDLTYSNNLTKAVVAVSAFNFPDVTSISFSCKTKSCIKGNTECNEIMPPRCGMDRMTSDRNDDPEAPLTNDIENDQLITTTQASTTVSSTTQSTSTVPPTTTSIPTTTTTLATTTVVTTTVTEITASTTGVPETTTTVLQSSTEVFPTPQDMSKYVDVKISKALEVLEEGSGIEDKAVPPTPVSLIVASEDPAEIYVRPTEKKQTTIKRRRDAIVEADISSQSLTVVEKDSDISLPDPAAQFSAPPTMPSPPSVCIPMHVFWILIGVLVFCGSLIVSVFCYAQRQKNKFRMLP